jgi:putative glutathione S-transferase
MPKSLPTPSIIQLGRFHMDNDVANHDGQLATLAAKTENISDLAESAFRQVINGDDSPYHAQAEDAIGYSVGMSCPWAHRTLIIPGLEGLEGIPVSLAVLLPENGGWLLANPIAMKAKH